MQSPVSPQPRDERPVRRRATVEASLQADEALQLIAEGVTKVAGFGVAAISVAREDGHLHVTAVAGSEEARAYLEGVRTPIAELLAELERGDAWGHFRFVPHDRMSDHEGEWGWVPDVQAPQVEGAWHPLDLLAAPLLDAHGRLRGTLSIDLPSDGRVPGPEKRRVLDLYAEQAAQAVVTALEREELAAEVRLATAARRAVRTSPSHHSLQQVLDDARGPLLEGFGALGLWMHVTSEGGGVSAVHSSDGRDLQLPPDLVALATDVATSLWELERVAVIDPDRREPLLSPEEEQEVRAVLVELDVGAAMIVPLGLGSECVGVLVLSRPVDGLAWSDAEEGAALEVGRDLGGAVLRAKLMEREHRLVQQLRELDGYRSRMVATVSHELRNPLTAIVGHLEMLEGHPQVGGSAVASLSAMESAAQRLTRLADDLLMLARVTAASEADPADRTPLAPVDLLAVVTEVVELLAPENARRRQQVEVDAGDGSTVVLGDRDQLDHLVSNLVGNATKYTPDGGRIRVELTGPTTDRAPGAGEVVLAVVDDGIGISEADQQMLFTEFFRSEDTRARQQRGTGLGLSIVRSVVRRHGATIEVESAVGSGSTFRVRFPAPGSPG